MNGKQRIEKIVDELFMGYGIDFSMEIAKKARNARIVLADEEKEIVIREANSKIMSSDEHKSE